MKNFAVLFAAFAMLCSAAVSGAEYQEGVNYQIRGSQSSAQKEIREFFSFWCGHCFGLQPTFHKIEEHFSGEARFVKNPVGLLGGSMGPVSQQGFAVAALMNLEDEYTAALFDEMHVQGNIPHSEQDLIAFFGEHLGIPADKVSRDLKSFPVAGMVGGFDKAVEDAEIDAVPELLVNGKYLVTMESVNSDEELIDLIAYLLTLD